MNAPRWVLLGLAGAAAAAVSSGVTPWLRALGGAFRPPDFAADVAAARLLIAGSNPYSSMFQGAHAEVLQIPHAAGYPYLPHPPLVVLASVPFGFGSFESAAAVWFALSLAMVFVLALLLSEAAAPTAARTHRRVWLWFVALLAWPPTLYTLEKGQVSILLAVLLAFTWLALRRGQVRTAGAVVGLTAAIKVFPVLLGGWLLMRYRRALPWAIAAGALTTVVPLSLLGWDGLIGYVQHSQANLQYWETWPAVTYSVQGALARLFINGQWTIPWSDAPVVTTIGGPLIGTALVAGALFVSRVRDGAIDESASFAAWMTLLVILNPLSMGHNGVLLALPVVLTASTLTGDNRVWPKATWGVAVALISIPWQTLAGLVSQPVHPISSIGIVALPMWGGLMLFAVAVACANGDARSLRARSTTAACPLAPRESLIT